MAGTIVFGLHRAARVVLDPRDWVGTSVRPGPSMLLPDGEVVAPVVRVTVPLTVTATPVGPGWPFAGPVELVTQTTPAGLVAFFGRVKSPDGGPLRRLSLAGVTCDLSVTAEGYRPVTLTNVPVPKLEDPPSGPTQQDPPPAPTLRKFFLYPTGPLPDGTAGPTVLAGRVTNPDGSGLPRVKVSRDNPAATIETDENGEWLLEHEPPTGPTVGLRFAFPDGTTVAVPVFRVVRNRLNRYPRTTLSGRVVRAADGRPVPGAAVGMAMTAGTTLTRPDGWFVFAVPVETRTGAAPQEITVTPPGGAPVKVTRTVTFGQDNPLGPVGI